MDKTVCTTTEAAILLSYIYNASIQAGIILFSMLLESITESVCITILVNKVLTILVQPTWRAWPKRLLASRRPWQTDDASNSGWRQWGVVTDRVAGGLPGHEAVRPLAAHYLQEAIKLVESGRVRREGPIRDAHTSVLTNTPAADDTRASALHRQGYTPHDALIRSWLTHTLYPLVSWLGS